MAFGVVVLVTTTGCTMRHDRPDDAGAAPRVLPDESVCRAAELSATAEDRGSLMSNTKTQVVLTNTGTRQCALAGTVGLDGVRSDGSVVALETSTGTYFGEPAPSSGTLAPGDAAAFYLAGGRGCTAAVEGHRQTWSAVRVRLPSGGGSIDVRTRFDTVCGVAVSGIGRPDPDNDLG